MTQAMFRVLVVEDDPDIQRVLQTLLEAAHYRVLLAGTAARALIEARSHQPDVILVDLGLPDRDGQGLVRDIRGFSAVPILVLSARSMEVEKIHALDGGADDYVTKPFDAGELLARIRAALRRGSTVSEQSPRLCIGGATIDLATRMATSATGAAIRFTPLEFRILTCLARHLGMVVTQDQLIREVWGPDRVTDTRGLRSYVKTLRQKLEVDPSRPRLLVTEPGVGYRLLGEPDDQAASR